MNGIRNINMTKGDHIPDDIIADILSKLPSKSLLRFKIACKTWYSLIFDPEFINLHSKLACQNPKLLFSARGSQSPLQLLDYETPSFDDSCLSEFPREMCTKILGSSCGLVCLDTHLGGENFTIVNPLTGKRRKIPKLRRQITKHSGQWHYIHGLGYDAVANDFKLVIAMDGNTYDIFSLKSNSWKTIICAFPLGSYRILPFCTLGTILNGIIFHWLVVERHSQYCGILAFDAAKETFEMLELPKVTSRFNNLFEHKGCLCVSLSSLESSDINKIWIMNEYRVWVHFLTIKNLPPTLYHFPMVLCISRKNEVVFHGKKKFIRSRRGEEEDKLDKLPIRKDVYAAVFYVETLVSPNLQEVTDNS